MNRNKKHRRPHRKAKNKATKDFARVTKEMSKNRPDWPKLERTEAEKFRDAAMVGFMFEAAKKIFGPMFERMGLSIAGNMEETEWPEYLEEKENVK